MKGMRSLTSWVWGHDPFMSQCLVIGKKSLK